MGTGTRTSRPRSGKMPWPKAREDTLFYAWLAGGGGGILSEFFILKTDVSLRASGGREGIAEPSSGSRGRELKSTRHSIHMLDMVTTTKLHPLQGRWDIRRISVCNIIQYIFFFLLPFLKFRGVILILGGCCPIFHPRKTAITCSSDHSLAGCFVFVVVVPPTAHKHVILTNDITKKWVQEFLIKEISFRCLKFSTTKKLWKA